VSEYRVTFDLPAGRSTSGPLLRHGDARDEYDAAVGRLMLVLLRFCDPDNDKRFVGEEAERYWMGGDQPGGVDCTVGGTEHAVLHLLYARFWQKVYSTWVTSRSPNRSSGW